MKFVSLIILAFLIAHFSKAQPIPLPEHPNPIQMRENWKNLNGDWDFEYDSLDRGLNENWGNGDTAFTHSIVVPFPWGSNLSGVEDLADIGWYKRNISVTLEWKGKRTFRVF